MNRLYTYLSPLEKIKEHEIILLIDTFRATTTINSFFYSGAEKVLVTDNIDKSYKLKKHGYILCGERKSQKIENFDFSNSPNEILNNPEYFVNKKVLLNTTNGAKTFSKINSISNVIALALVNVDAVIENLDKFSDIGIVCSGIYGNYCLEDHYTAHIVINKIIDRYKIKNDATIMSNKISLDLKDLKDSNHYSFLKKLNLEKDIEICLDKNKFNTVPYSDKNSNIFKMI